MVVDAAIAVSQNHCTVNFIFNVFYAAVKVAAEDLACRYEVRTAWQQVNHGKIDGCVGVVGWQCERHMSLW